MSSLNPPSVRPALAPRLCCFGSGVVAFAAAALLFVYGHWALALAPLAWFLFIAGAAWYVVTWREPATITPCPWSTRAPVELAEISNYKRLAGSPVLDSDAHAYVIA